MEVAPFCFRTPYRSTITCLSPLLSPNLSPLLFFPIFLFAQSCGCTFPVNTAGRSLSPSSLAECQFLDQLSPLIPTLGPLLLWTFAWSPCATHQACRQSSLWSGIWCSSVQSTINWPFPWCLRTGCTGRFPDSCKDESEYQTFGCCLSMPRRTAWFLSLVLPSSPAGSWSAPS